MLHSCVLYRYCLHILAHPCTSLHILAYPCPSLRILAYPCTSLRILAHPCTSLKKKKVFKRQYTVPVLRAYKTDTINLSRNQCASLLACSFFCLHRRPPTSKYPHANFSSLFRSSHPSQYAKFRCLLHYFDRLRIEVKSWREKKMKEKKKRPSLVALLFLAY